MSGLRAYNCCREPARMNPFRQSVHIKITGKWEDGTAFEAYDIIRVINP